MNREQFLTKLSRKLKGLPPGEREDALRYYSEYLDEAGPEKEAETIAEWGNPEAVASQILADCALKRTAAEPSAKKGLSTAWVVFLAICASPIALPAAAVLLCVMFALVAAVAAVVLAIGACAGALAAGGVLSVVTGLGAVFQSFPTALFFIGMGLLCAGAGTALFPLVVWLAKTGFHQIARLFSNVLRRRNRT